MTRAPTHATAAGRNYLALQRLAREQGRATDELLQLFALESFLDRLSSSGKPRDFVLKGGVLLAAYGLRRPTRDIDLSTRQLRNDENAMLEWVRGILAQPRDDGWTYGAIRAETIREGDQYRGLRMSIEGLLGKARGNFHVDVNFGDPVWPAPRWLEVPRLLGGSVRIHGYPLAMVHAEKIVTCVQRGTANTRWRDFADIYLLARMHPITNSELSKAIEVVAGYRHAQMMPLRRALEGFAPRAQSRWAAWVRRQALERRLPTDFSTLQTAIEDFVDPVLSQRADGLVWSHAPASWHAP